MISSRRARTSPCGVLPRIVASWIAVARRCAAASLLVASVACGSSLPAPPTGPHLADEPTVVVPYPPPPARVEIVPPPPDAKHVWLDGEWQWRSRRWVWLPGRWEVPYPGAYFAPATTVRRADGALVWFAGAWQASGKK